MGAQKESQIKKNDSTASLILIPGDYPQKM